MHDGPDPRGQVQMHRASVLVRQVLVLNEVMEYEMRRAMDLNDTDFQAMQHLLKNRAMEPGELALALHLTAAATTTVIDRLAGKGHVVRVQHPSDRRRLLIKPSADSVRRTMEKIMPMIMQVDDKVRSYDDAGQRLIIDFLDSIVAFMGERIAVLESSAPNPEPPDPTSQGS